MAKLYKLNDFQADSGNWHIVCVDQVGKIGNAWYFPARVLGISISDFILLLKEKYNANLIEWTEYDNSSKPPFLYYNWTSYKDVHKFVLDVNREARMKNFLI